MTIGRLPAPILTLPRPRLLVPDLRTEPCQRDEVLPKDVYFTTVWPTWYRLDGRWQLPEIQPPDQIVVLTDGELTLKPPRSIKAGDQVVCCTREDGTQGVWIDRDPEAYERWLADSQNQPVARRYEQLLRAMASCKEHGKPIVWALGPAIVFDHDAREALSDLARARYVSSVLAGNAMATHDLEGGWLHTALGQDIYTQETRPLGHYNHLDLLNAVRTEGGTESFITSGQVEDGLVKTLIEEDISLCIAGSLRDDGPLPEVIPAVSDSLDEMGRHLSEAGLIIGVATMLHSCAAAGQAPCWRRVQTTEEVVRIEPVPFAVVDITHPAVDLISEIRSGLTVDGFITNAQDFVVQLRERLVPGRNS